MIDYNNTFNNYSSYGATPSTMGNLWDSVSSLAGGQVTSSPSIFNGATNNANMLNGVNLNTFSGLKAVAPTAGMNTNTININGTNYNADDVSFDANGNPVVNGNKNSGFMDGLSGTLEGLGSLANMGIGIMNAYNAYKVGKEQIANARQARAHAQENQEYLRSERKRLDGQRSSVTASYNR